jgi:hypothetical protein
MKKKKVNLSTAKLKQQKNKLTDNQISTAISAITTKYLNVPFEDIKDKLDEEYREVFKYSDYDYHGYKTDLGTVYDIDIIITKKDKLK